MWVGKGYITASLSDCAFTRRVQTYEVPGAASYSMFLMKLNCDPDKVARAGVIVP